MGPPEVALGESGEEGAEEDCVVGGRVSQERVRRQDCRIREKEVGSRGSCVEV